MIVVNLAFVHSSLMSDKHCVHVWLCMKASKRLIIIVVIIILITSLDNLTTASTHQKITKQEERSHKLLAVLFALPTYFNFCYTIFKLK